MTDHFPARVRQSGGSKVLTIPEAIAEGYKAGDPVDVTLEKRPKQGR